MSTPTQNDLQSAENSSNEALADPEVIRTLESTARMISTRGWMESFMITNHGNTARFSFLKSSDPFHALYQHKLSEYRAKNQGVQPDAPSSPATDDVQPDLPRKFPFTYPQGITLKELALIKLTAQFVVRYGMAFSQDLMERVITNPLFEFMKTTDCRFSFFRRLVDAYARVLRPCQKMMRPGACTTFLEGFFSLVQEEGVERHAFVGGVDYFANTEDEEPTQMEPAWPDFPDHPRLRSMPLAPRNYPLMYPEEMTRKEVGITKLTAQFLVRYGVFFWEDLMKRVTLNPRFKFIKTTDLYSLFNRLVGAYSRVLLPCKKLMKPGARTEPVLEGFFRLIQGEKLEEGVEMATIDSHAFVSGLDYFANREDESCDHMNTFQYDQGNTMHPLNICDSKAG